MSSNYYKSGDWNSVCDVCGFAFKASQLRKRWDGFMVCDADWEPRHQIDFLRAPPSPRAIPWSRPEPADVFVDVTYADNGSTVPSGTFLNDYVTYGYVVSLYTA